MRSPFGRRITAAGTPIPADPPPVAVPPLELARRRRFLVSDGRWRTKCGWVDHCRAMGWPCVAIADDQVILTMETCGWGLTAPALARLRRSVARARGLSWACMRDDIYTIRVAGGPGCPAAETIAFMFWEISLDCRPIELIPDD
jgi:hypothetical protein